MHSIAISQGNTREAGAAPIRVVAPHEEGRAALYALTAALLLPPTADDGEPQVDPSASRYRQAANNGNTLVEVRAALHGLGLARREGVAEMEDHLGMLCEAMRLLIAGGPGVGPRPLGHQRPFFAAHVAPWHRACANDIRSARGANFLCRVADVMETFFDVEAEAFEIGDIAARVGRPRREAGDVRHRSAAALSRKSAWPNRK